MSQRALTLSQKKKIIITKQDDCQRQEGHRSHINCSDCDCALGLMTMHIKAAKVGCGCLHVSRAADEVSERPCAPQMTIEEASVPSAAECNQGKRVK